MKTCQCDGCIFGKRFLLGFCIGLVVLFLVGCAHAAAPLPQCNDNSSNAPCFAGCFAQGEDTTLECWDILPGGKPERDTAAEGLLTERTGQPTCNTVLKFVEGNRVRCGYDMPNPKLTPGLTVPMSLHQVCTTKWGADVRHVTPKMKREVCLAYGIKSGCPGPRYEIDHLIPRELGGADSVKNLWPQPIKEAKVKDFYVENALHKNICIGLVTANGIELSHISKLQNAQQGIAKDWTQFLPEKPMNQLLLEIKSPSNSHP